MRRGVPAPVLVAGEAPRSRGPMRRGFDMTGANLAVVCTQCHFVTDRTGVDGRNRYTQAVSAPDR